MNESFIADHQVESENSDVIKYLVFDEKKVWRNASFVFHKIDDDQIGIGIMMPKEKEVRDEKGNVEYTDQEIKPFVVTSGRRIIPASNKYQRDFKIKINRIPDYMKRRWSLESIKIFLDGKNPEIQHGFKEVFDLMCYEYDKYISVQNKIWHKINVLWDMGTYFFFLFDYFPISEKRGIKGSGKTKRMKISRLFTWNATPIWVNPSASTLFRETDEIRPTKYIDEAEKIWRYDFKNKDVVSDDRAELLNASFQKGSTVPRQEPVGRNKWKTVHFNAYSPAMIGSIYGLRGATEDRAIIEICVKNSVKDERGELEPNESDYFYQEIRDSLYLLLLNNWKKVEKEYNSFKNETKLKSRDYNIWKPLLVIAKFISKELYEEIKDYAEKSTEIKKDDSIDNHSLDYKLLNAAYSCLVNNDGWFSYSQISQKMGEDIHGNVICSKLDKYGLKEYRHRTNSERGYRIKLSQFVELISQSYPNIDFLSQSSQLSQLYTINKKNDMTINDNKEDKVTVKSDNCDEIDNSDAQNESKTELEIAKEVEEIIKNSNGKNIEDLIKEIGESYRTLIDSIIQKLLRDGSIYFVKYDFVRWLL